MRYRDTALHALEQTRSALRQTLAEAVAAEAFADVAVIANVAEKIATLSDELRRADVEVGNSPAASPAAVFQTSDNQGTNQSPTPVTARLDDAPTGRTLAALRRMYPQYLREGDRL